MFKQADTEYRNEIIEMARQVWLSDYGSKVMLGGEDVEINLEDLEAFAKLVAQHEREACLSCYSVGDDVTDWVDKILARGEAQ